MLEAKQEERKAQRATQVDTDASKRARESEQSQIRKAQREALLKRKRSAAERELPPPTRELIQEITDGLKSPEHRQEAVEMLRQYLAMDKDPPTKWCIDCGVVPMCTEFLKDSTQPTLQFEAAWVLTNIASGTAEETSAVVSAGCIPLFVELCGSPSTDVVEQAVWALGNLAGDGPVYRDQILAQGAMPRLIEVLSATQVINVARTGTWALANLCRGKPPPPSAICLPALPIFAQSVMSTDVDVQTDALWGLSYLTEGQVPHIDAVISTGCIARVCELMTNGSVQVATPALRVTGNLVSTHSSEHTDAAVRAGCLPNLNVLLSHSRRAIRRETCWALSNIAASRPEHVGQLLECGVMKTIVHLLENGEWDVRQQAIWVLSNVTARVDAAVAQHCVEAGAIRACLALLDFEDPAVVLVTLDALDNILFTGNTAAQAAGQVNPYVSVVEKNSGVASLEALQQDENSDVVDRALNVLTTYFKDDSYDGFDLGQLDAAESAFDYAR